MPGYSNPARLQTVEPQQECSEICGQGSLTAHSSRELPLEYSPLAS